MNLITLQSSKFSARIYVYLRALSLADMGFMIFVIICLDRRTHNMLHTTVDNLAFQYPTVLYRIAELPIINGFFAASVFIVVCMTIDR